MTMSPGFGEAGSGYAIETIHVHIYCTEKDAT